MDKLTIINTINAAYYPIPEACQEELYACSKVLKLDKQAILVKAGMYSDKAYYIAKGSARAYYLKDGRDITDWFAFENEFISAINSFFQNVPSPHYIATVEGAILLEVKRDDVNFLSDKYRTFDRLGKLVVTNTMLKLQHRIISSQFESAQQRYANLIAMRPDIVQRIPLTHIASYLGMTLETLSRVRSNF